MGCDFLYEVNNFNNCRLSDGQSDRAFILWQDGVENLLFVIDIYCAWNAESSAPNNYRKIKDTKFTWFAICLRSREQEKNNCNINNYLSTNLSKEISLFQNLNTHSTLTHTLQLLTVSKLSKI